MPQNKRGGHPGEAAARALKASLLADFLTKYGFTLDLVERLDDDGWRTVANCARINPPSPTTQAIVIAILRKRHSTMSREEFRYRLAALELRTRPKPPRRKKALAKSRKTA